MREPQYELLKTVDTSEFTYADWFKLIIAIYDRGVVCPVN